jgi:hypothetical protein
MLLEIPELDDWIIFMTQNILPANWNLLQVKILVLRAGKE